MPEPLSSVESPSHPIRVSLNGPRATITLSQADAALDRDFVLELGVANLNVPRAWIERDDEGNEAAAIGFYPRFEHASVPSEIVFVVDRSGSMQGDSIEEVRNALQLCLRSMIPGCAFNIIGFGSTFQPLFTESRPYDDSTVAYELLAGHRPFRGKTSSRSSAMPTRCGRSTSRRTANRSSSTASARTRTSS